MTAVALSVGAISIYFLYQAAIEEKKEDLRQIVKSQARFIEAVARFDIEQSDDFPGGHLTATLSQIQEAHQGFDETGDFYLARLEGDQIVYLLSHPHFPPTFPKSQKTLPFRSKFAEPMRRALSGQSGVMVNRDYRGKNVLAAYEPVAVLNLGLVAKIDLVEIKAPFIKAVIMAGVAGVIAILLGFLVFLRLSEPLVRSIKELQERYTLSVKGAEEGLWDWPDIDKNEEWWSDEYYRLLGFPEGEIEASYSSFLKLLHPDDLPRMEKALKSHFDGKEDFDVEFRLKHKSGEYKWFHSRGAVKRDRSGKPIRMSGSISDIHAQKLVREKIERLSQVAQQIPISVIITDEKGNIKFVNQALTKLTGYSQEEVLGKNPRIFKSGESPDTYYQVLWNTISQGKEWRGVFHNKKKNGELYWESVLIFSLKDINEKITNFIAVKEDITEKKQMESTLIDHERLIRSVVNNLKDGLVIANLDGNIQLFNHGAEKIFGYKAYEVMNKPVVTLIDEPYKEKHLAGINNFRTTKLLSKQNILLEAQGIKKDGSPVPIELNLTQMEQRGEVLVIGLIRDISEKKEAEQRMELAQQQIIATQKLAGIGELAAGVSHEVLNPVNIISVHTQMLQKNTTDDPKIQKFCAKVLHEVDRIVKIMGSLLAFSRKSDAVLEKNLLRETIENVLVLVEEEYKLDNISIVRNWCGQTIYFLYDADKMRQVILNLLINAKHAMPNGGTITISCNNIKISGKSYHQFKLSDTGMGMSEEVLSKIFTPFFTTKPEGKGTGLGLSVVYGIIQEHGGTISAQSAEGKGTTFIITLPVLNLKS
jgi:nitrogen fixation negative regulator NifL